MRRKSKNRRGRLGAGVYGADVAERPSDDTNDQGEDGSGTTLVTAQDWEKSWWESCKFNTFSEEAKQITYAHLMGLVNEPREGKWPIYDLRGSSVIDLGGGPASMLLKTVGGNGVVVDPCPYPDWVADRYAHAEIDYYVEEAETYTHPYRSSECWIYNVLQHVVDPEAVIASASRNAHTLRIFDWLETPPNEGHPHTLHAADLDRWIGGTGTVGYINENGAVGLAYWGHFQL